MTTGRVVVVTTGLDGVTLAGVCLDGVTLAGICPPFTPVGVDGVLVPKL